MAVGGAKTIGLGGSVMLLTNNLAGPALSLMPVLAHRAGWLPVLSVMLALGGIAGSCAWMLLYALRRLPGNMDYQLRVEFADLTHHYFGRGGGRAFHVLAMVSFFGYLVLTLVSYIVQTAQVLDHSSRNVFGCAYAVGIWPDFATGLCGTHEDTTTPFAEVRVLPLSFLGIALLCAPMAWLNLDDNVVLQWVAVIGLLMLGAMWLVFFSTTPGFPHSAELPIGTTSRSAWSQLCGVLLFNFASVTTLPSWVNEKAPEVPTMRVVCISLGLVIALYSSLGIVGALAFDDWGRGNLFTKLNRSGSSLMKATVGIYPLLQNLTTIPVLSILIKYNLLQLGWVGRRDALLISFVLPWLLSIVFYGGDGFAVVCEVGGLAFSSIVNFLVPVALFWAARGEESAAVSIPKSQ
mmetsp:Transcript_11344/g.40236  ORF Transcript_11344/g.40236 Transcript_11344/m.40236 type:complete len:406 (-) Transcript_11344:62-1279(-)